MVSRPSVTISIPSLAAPEIEKPVDETQVAEGGNGENPVDPTQQEPEPRPIKLDDESVEEYYSRLAQWFLSDPDKRKKVTEREWEHITFSIQKMAGKYHNNFTEREAGRILVGFLNRFYLKSGDRLLLATAQQILFTILYEDLITNLHRTNGILPGEQTIVLGESK